MEKQIEAEMLEMLEIIEKSREEWSNDVTDHTENEYIREGLLNGGYRKQIVAEWKAGNENGQYGHYCSSCKAGFTGENAELIAKEHDFCPKCGAKMKGVQKHFSFEDVRKMSDSDVRKNYQAILDSMREWK